MSIFERTVQKLILSESSNSYLGFAKNKLREILRAKEDTGLDFIQRAYVINNHTIIVMSNSFMDRIIIFGGAEYPILFMSDSLLFGYSYESDALIDFFPMGGGAELSQLSDGKVWVDGVEQYKTQLISKESSFEQSKSYLAEDYEFQVTYSTQEVTTDSSKSTKLVGTYEGKDIVIGDLPFDVLFDSTMTNGFLNVVGAESAPYWNEFNCALGWLFSSSSSAAIFEFNWVPAIFIPEAGDTFTPLGWHYGYPKIDERNFEPYTDIKVTFSGVLDSRIQSTPLVVKYGYFETITSTTGGDLGSEQRNEFDTYFFLSPDPPPVSGNPVYGYESNSGATYSGSTPIATQPTFNIDSLSSLGTPLGDPNIHLWSTDEPPIDPEKEEPLIPIIRDMFGCFIKNDRKADLYRVQVNLAGGFIGGSPSLLKHFEGVVGHSVSFDGKIVAVFTGGEADGVWTIHQIDVYDVQKGELLRSSKKMKSKKAITGAVVLKSEKPKGDANLKAVSISRINQKELPHLGTIRYSTMMGMTSSIQWGMYLNKILCTDGKHATVKTESDTCFKVEFHQFMYSGELDSETDDVSINVNGEEYSGKGMPTLAPPQLFQPYLPRNGVLLCGWKGGKPTLEGVSCSAGKNTSYRVFTQDKEVGVGSILGINSDEYAIVGRMLGEVDESSLTCLEYKSGMLSNPVMKIQDSCMPECKGTVSIGGMTTCDQTIKGEIEVDPNPLFIEAPKNFYVGNKFFGSGGGGDPEQYTWSSKSFELDAKTGEILSIKACASDEVSVTLSDNCANPITAIYDYVGGGKNLTIKKIKGGDSENFEVGHIYEAGGGEAPITWSISCGAIKVLKPTTQVEITSKGCCFGKVVELKAEDNCGRIAKIEAKGSGDNECCDGEQALASEVGASDRQIPYNACVVTISGGKPPFTVVVKSPEYATSFYQFSGYRWIDEGSFSVISSQNTFSISGAGSNICCKPVEIKLDVTDSCGKSVSVNSVCSPQPEIPGTPLGIVGETEDAKVGDTYSLSTYACGVGNGFFVVSAQGSEAAITPEGEVTSIGICTTRFDVSNQSPDCPTTELHKITSYSSLDPAEDDSGVEITPPVAGYGKTSIFEVPRGIDAGTRRVYDNGEYSDEFVRYASRSGDMTLTVRVKKEELVIIGSDVVDIGSTFTVQNASGTVEWSATGVTLDENQIVTQIVDCRGGTISVSDECNKTATKTVSIYTDPLSIGGPLSDVTVGSQFSAGGGCEYSWSFSKGGIDNTGKVTSVNCGSPGTPAVGTVTVTSGSQSASMEVSLLGGSWVLTKSESTDANIGWPCSYITHYVPSDTGYGGFPGCGTNVSGGCMAISAGHTHERVTATSKIIETFGGGVYGGYEGSSQYGPCYALGGSQTGSPHVGVCHPGYDCRSYAGWVVSRNTYIWGC